MTDIKTDFMVERAEGDVSFEMRLAKQAADLLHAHYPGHLWAVSVDTDGGVMYIKNLAISSLYGYVLHLHKLDKNLKRVMRAGGEYLERANMLKRFTGDFATHVEGMPDKHQPLRNGKLVQ